MRAKFVQYCPIKSERARSSGRDCAPSRESRVPKTYSMSSEWKAPLPAGWNLSAGAAKLEVVAIDGRFAGLCLRFQPAPRGIGNEAIAREIVGGL